MSSKLFTVAIVLTFLSTALGLNASRAEDAAPPPPAAAKSASPPAPNSSTQLPAANSPPAPEAPKPGETAKSPIETSTSVTVDLLARPFAYTEGKAGRDDIYGAILESLALVKRELEKSSVTPAGRPIAVFVESDENGFRYHAGFPLDVAPEGKNGLSDAVKIGQTPSGKAMRFEHLGSYADIDATYDAITAYLDEKGIDAQDSFLEEYANDVKDADDPSLQVNIYVLLK